MALSDVETPAALKAIDEYRDPLVLIAPSYGNPATRRRFHDTLAQPIDFTVPRLFGLLSTTDTEALLARHPDGSARFWGALEHHNSVIDRLRDGDVVVFTGDNRVQAVGIMGYRFRNPQLADTLWPPKTGDTGWLNVYTLTAFQRIGDVRYPELRAWVASAEKDIFQSARLLDSAKSAAVIAGLGVTTEADLAAEDRLAEIDLLAALGADEVVDAEQVHVDSTSYERTAGTVLVRRAEARLVARYRESLGSTGNHRLKSAVGFTDLYLNDDSDIIEAKRSAEHRYIREALGQLLDYAVNTTVAVHRLTALFPSRPASPDIRLLHTYGIDCLYWNGGNDFVRLEASDAARMLMRPLWGTNVRS
ncbi:hypothetical protein KZ829_03095 [Actinoplanes hulinensis]|uniref:Uncharacterized protein n=1 Tax=Actinoplanes hulinensis TaxID=1144547 RepID=A0ABS7AWF2_9ACTN|nr:hypothetical protein [Actinoplanes hulinensis]MBW6432726.1 hypothetical protein [Actinoplanes hulinensis]